VVGKPFDQFVDMGKVAISHLTLPLHSHHGCVCLYLSIFTLYVQGYMLRVLAMEWGGLKLPNDSFLRDWSFADDTTLYLVRSNANLKRVRAVLNLFCEATDVKINWKILTTIWTSPNPRSCLLGARRGASLGPKRKGSEIPWPLGQAPKGSEFQHIPF